MKTKKKKKSKVAVKAGAKKSTEQRRYEHETIRRERNLSRLETLLDAYNTGQEKRDAFIAKVYGVSANQRARLVAKIDAETKRQAGMVAKHPELKKLGIGVKLGKLAGVAEPDLDWKALRALPGAPGKAGTAGKARKGKVRRKKTVEAAEAAGEGG